MESSYSLSTRDGVLRIGILRVRGLLGSSCRSSQFCHVVDEHTLKTGNRPIAGAPGSCSTLRLLVSLILFLLVHDDVFLFVSFQSMMWWVRWYPKKYASSWAVELNLGIESCLGRKSFADAAELSPFMEPAAALRYFLISDLLSSFKLHYLTSS